MRPPEGGQPFSWPCRPLVGPLAASRAEGREQRKERREKKNEKTRFFCFSLSAEGVFPKDRVSLFPSRWLAVAASERKRGIFTGIPEEKTFDFLRKTSFFGKPLFCIQRWLGYLFWTSWGHPDGARGRNCTPQKKLVIPKTS